MLYWRIYVKSGCAIAGFHCRANFDPKKHFPKNENLHIEHNFDQSLTLRYSGVSLYQIKAGWESMPSSPPVSFCMLFPKKTGERKENGIAGSMLSVSRENESQESRSLLLVRSKASLLLKKTFFIDHEKTTDPQEKKERKEKDRTY